MNKSQAIAAMQKLWGVGVAAWRYNEGAATGEEREAIKETLEQLSKAYTDAKADREARRVELLKDAEYVRLCEVAKAVESAHAHALGRYYARRVTIGTVKIGFFTIKGEGDNWQEAVDNARARE